VNTRAPLRNAAYILELAEMRSAQDRKRINALYETVGGYKAGENREESAGD
jgi:hypothetical protein